MISFLIALGLLGFLGLTVLCPFLAYAGFYAGRRPEADGLPGRSPVRSLEVVIPAHDEAGHIGGTLESVLRSVRLLAAESGGAPSPRVAVRVIADGCADGTAEAARRFPGVLVSESAERKGKWAAVKSALESCSADWIILVDAGTLWPERFLADFVERISREPRAIAAAPSYKPAKAGGIQGALWRVEKALKTFEGRCGGPVSLHGATVGYKTLPAKESLALLGGRSWLNDDVVLPLAMRALNPDGVILYPVGEVEDAGVRPAGDVSRRKRMLWGNLQWAGALLPGCFRRNPAAGVLAFRRIFRVFWAWWAAFVALGAALAFSAAALPLLGAAAGLLSASSGAFRQVAGAALVSLAAPLNILRPGGAARAAWK